MVGVAQIKIRIFGKIILNDDPCEHNDLENGNNSNDNKIYDLSDPDFYYILLVTSDFYEFIACKS